VTRRRGRPRKRWKEEVERDLQVLGVSSRIDEQRRKYSQTDKRARDKLVRSPRENGGG